MALKKLVREVYENPNIKYEYKKGPLDKIKEELKEFLSYSNKELVTPISLSHAISPPDSYTTSEINNLPSISGGKIQFMQTKSPKDGLYYQSPILNFIYLEETPEEDLDFVREIITRNGLEIKLE